MHEFSLEENFDEDLRKEAGMEQHMKWGAGSPCFLFFLLRALLMQYDQF